jgi:OmpR-family two-component system manganese-sensing sensor histidine kinase
MRILIIEDDNRIAKPLAEDLKHQNHVVDIANDGIEGLEYAQSGKYDLILLDLMLPRLDGITVCQRLRADKYSTPILMLTARDTTSDKIIGLDAGADDYLVKPFELEELAARIRALARRNIDTRQPILIHGDLQLDPSNCNVTYAGKHLSLTPKEYMILECFLKNPTQVLTRLLILDKLWEFDKLSGEETVKTHIANLRKKLKTVGSSEPIIGSDNKKLIGYVRASQSLEEFNETLNKLDWGLGGGVIVALVISGVGGVWLTRQAMQPIEESFERLKQFTADASHELRSPLMVIKSNTAVALKYPEGIRETDAEKFQAITSATNQMTHLTENLLFLARYDKLPNQGQENINIAFVLDNLIELYEPQAVSKQIILKYQLNENFYIRGDSIELIRLFTNLIQNAIHYTPLAGTIEITASRIGSHIIVDVKDTGVGIALDHLEKVFERFWRADKSRSYNFGGSGLGLAIAQAIAQNHGGLITVTSQLEIGSCFTVRLPASLLN